jgi:type II secretory pathway pseudopilin PulG
MSLRPLLVLLLLGALIPAATGCDRIRGALDSRRELTEEQRAIQAYSDATEQVNQKQQRFVQAWDQAVKNEEVEPLKKAIAKDVLPALEEYTAALRKMPTGTADLERIHGIVLAAYESTLEELKGFQTTLNEDNRKEPVDALIAKLAELSTSEQAYREQLKAYYEKHNITLIPDKQEQAEAKGKAEAKAEPAEAKAEPAEAAEVPAPDQAPAPAPGGAAPEGAPAGQAPAADAPAAPTPADAGSADAAPAPAPDAKP